MNLDAKTPGQQESQKEGEMSDADESKEIQRIAEVIFKERLITPATEAVPRFKCTIFSRFQPYFTVGTAGKLMR
jgi:hypothetical protein